MNAICKKNEQNENKQNKNKQNKYIGRQDDMIVCFISVVEDCYVLNKFKYVWKTDLN